MDESPDRYPLALHEHSWPDYTYHMGQSFCKYKNNIKYKRDEVFHFAQAILVIGPSEVPAL